MGRSFQADGAVEAYITELITSGQWHVGLIVGQLTASSKDFVVRLIRTPDPAEDEVSEEEVEGEEVVPEKKKKTEKAGSLRPKSLDLVDEQWVATHAKQVSRMLPGGLDVVGIFGLAPPNMMQSAQAKLRQVLFAVHKALGKQLMPDKEDTITDRLLIQIDTASRKLTCRTFDVADIKSSARPADLKYQTGLLDRWSQLNTTVAVDLTIAVPQDTRTYSMHKQIQQGIQPFCKAIYGGTMLVDGVWRDSDETLDQSEPRKGRSKDKGQITQQKYDVELLINMSDNQSVKDPVIQAVKAILKVRGQIVGRAFVNNKATVDEAAEAVKCDVVRSLVSRCELLCEDLEIVEEDGAKELYNTPVRVFSHVEESSVDFCDYMFQDEKCEEVIERLAELLHITVTEDDLELQCERHADEDDWSGGEMGGDEGDQGGQSEGGKSGIGAYMGVAVSGVMAAVAGVVYLFYENT